MNAYLLYKFKACQWTKSILVKETSSESPQKGHVSVPLRAVLYLPLFPCVQAHRIKINSAFQVVLKHAKNSIPSGGIQQSHTPFARTSC